MIGGLDQPQAWPRLTASVRLASEPKRASEPAMSRPAVAVLAGGVAQHQPEQRGQRQAERQPREEDRAPVEQLDEDPAQHRPRGEADADDAADDAQRLSSMLRRDGGGDDRVAVGDDHRVADGLQPSRGHERGQRGREAAGEQPQRGDRVAGDVEALAPEQVSEPPERQREPGAEQHEDQHDPDHRVDRRAELGGECGQRDVDDRGVHRAQQHGARDECEHHPRRARLAGARVCAVLAATCCALAGHSRDDTGSRPRGLPSVESPWSTGDPNHNQGSPSTGSGLNPVVTEADDVCGGTGCVCMIDTHWRAGA